MTLEYNSHKRNLEHSGFTKISNFFEDSDLDDIQQMLDTLFQQENNASLHATRIKKFISSNIYEINHTIKVLPSLKKTAVFNKCQKLATELLGKHARVSFDHTIYKKPLSGAVNWHQDQAYKHSVKKMKSIHFWIPLQDTSRELGCMKYIQGKKNHDLLAHQKANNGHTLSVHLDEEEIKKDIVICESLKGDLQLHLPQTLHGSLPNVSSSVRKAWIIHFSPYGYYEPLLPNNIFYNACMRIKNCIKSLTSA
jgi:ectoine hydroxylase-related dioxygenase (phytanoyl-CoA dioxygenase family)